MSDQFTSNLNLTKPAVGQSVDSWGGKINSNLDSVDNIFSATGTEVDVRFNSANFNDNKKAVFGTTDALEIFHDGSNSLIKDIGTGGLQICASLLEIKNSANSTVIASFNESGAVAITGNVGITGNITISGTVDGVDLSSLATVATSGSYADLSNTPTIPTNNNQLTNGAGYTTYTSNQATDTTSTVDFANVSIGANGDIDFTAGTWTGEKAYKIQAHSNDLYIQYTEDIYFRNASGNDRCQMDASGNFYAEGNITAYASVSDEKLKENIEVIDNAIDKVNQLKGVTFNYKKDGKVGTGLIAQDLEKVLPEAVYTAQALGDHLKDEEQEEHLAINYGNTVGLLVEAIKELEARVKELEGK